MRKKLTAISLIFSTVILLMHSVSVYAKPIAGSSHLFAGSSSATNPTGGNDKSQANTALDDRKAGVGYIYATPFAGINLSVNNLLSNATYIAGVTVEDNNAEPVADMEYADIAVAQVDNFVYIRSNPTANSEVIGKLYNNSACKIIDATDGFDGDGRWYHITSGKCTGYVKSEFVVAGDAELAKSVSRRVATVNTITLNIRDGASIEADLIGQLPLGDDLTVIDESIRDKGWVMVSCEKGDGYVATEFVTLSTSYTLAESKAEEEARLAKEEAARKAALAAAARKAAQNKGNKYNYIPSNGNSGAQSVISFASQFVGNPYVYGGVSLTNGADCSGFVMSVYANFGVSLPHSSAALRNVGYAVPYDQMAPGDIVCYSGHVGLYAGNGQLLHASTPESGIKYSSVNYREILAIRRIF